MGAIGVSISYF